MAQDPNSIKTLLSGRVFQGLRRYLSATRGNGQTFNVQSVDHTDLMTEKGKFELND